MIVESFERVTHESGVSTEEMNVLVNASTLALGVLEDACWLQPVIDAQHINLTEFNTMVKGINVALPWQTKTLHLCTDSFCVYHWVSNILTGKVRICIKPASEMLIRWRLDSLV